MSPGWRLCHCPMANKYSSMQLLADALQEKMKGVFKSAEATVNVNGSTLELVAPTGYGMSIISDEQARVVMEGKPINSASKWFHTAAGGTILPAQTFSTGDVTLPRDVNTLYLHSDAFAGFRDTQGPVQGQRATIAKVAIGVTPAGAFHAESLYRPHLYTTLPRRAGKNKKTCT